MGCGWACWALRWSPAYNRDESKHNRSRSMDLSNERMVDMEAQIQTNRHYLIKLMAVNVQCPTCNSKQGYCLSCKNTGYVKLRNLVEAANPDMVRLVSDGLPAPRSLDKMTEDLRATLSPASTLPDSLIQPGPLSDESDGTS